MSWPDEITQVVSNDEEQDYLQRYQSLVTDRCEYLLTEADDIGAMRL